MGQFLRDLRYGLRIHLKSWGFAAVAIVILGLGIGFNTTIFSLIDAIMLHSLPVHDPAHLFVFKWVARARPAYKGYSSYEPCFQDPNQPPLPSSGCSFSYEVFNAILTKASVFSRITAYAPVQVRVTGNGAGSLIKGAVVSGQFFETFGVKAIFGRTLKPMDDTPGSEPAAVLSYRYWHSAMGGAPSVVGSTIHLNGNPFTIVGIAEPKFTGTSPGRTQDFWIPLWDVGRLESDWTAKMNDTSNWWLEVVARTKPGVMSEQAEAASTALFRHEMLEGTGPNLRASDDAAIVLTPVQKGIVGWRIFFNKPLNMLMIAVSIVLFIACANLSGLMLARTAARNKEVAVRLALGAGRLKIVRQLLSESTLLAVSGGILGVLISYFGVRSILRFISTAGLGSLYFDAHLDLRILGFTAGVSIITSVLFGLAPALQSIRTDLTPALSGMHAIIVPRSPSIRHRRLGFCALLVVMQVALAMLVLVGTGLIVHGLVNLEIMNPGFDTRNLLLFSLDAKLGDYKDEKLRELSTEIQRQLSSLPGVLSVSYSGTTLVGGSYMTTGLYFEGHAAPSAQADLLAVGPDFLETMRIPVVAGRTLGTRDIEEQSRAAQSVAVVNKMFAHRFFGNRDPIGHRFRTAKEGPEIEVVGVVEDAKYESLRKAVEPTVYVACGNGCSSFEVRTALDPRMLVPAIRELVGKLDNTLILFGVKTQTEQIDETLYLERLTANLSGLFAFSGLLLASIGLYGLLSYQVTCRTREIGVRLALGAQKRELLYLFMGHGILLTVIGATVGIVLALGLTRYLQSLLYGINATDPLTYFGGAILLTLVSIAACYLPARRTMRVDPSFSLRHE